MSKSESTLKLTNKAEENFNLMKDSIKGVHDVLKLVLDEKDVLYKVCMENLFGLYDNFLQLMMNDYGAHDFIRRLGDYEIDIRIDLDDAILDR